MIGPIMLLPLPASRVRKGDLLAVSLSPFNPLGFRTVEAVTDSDGQRAGFPSTPGQIFLISFVKEDPPVYPERVWVNGETLMVVGRKL